MHQNRDQLHENRLSAYIFSSENDTYLIHLSKMHTKKWSQTDLFRNFKSLHTKKYFNLHSLKVFTLLQRNVAGFIFFIFFIFFFIFKVGSKLLPNSRNLTNNIALGC